MTALMRVFEKSLKSLKATQVIAGCERSETSGSQNRRETPTLKGSNENVGNTTLTGSKTLVSVTVGCRSPKAHSTPRYYICPLRGLSFGLFRHAPITSVVFSDDTL